MHLKSLLTRGMFSGNSILSSWRTLEIAITDPSLSLSVPAVPCIMIETTSSDSPLDTNSLIAALSISVKKSLDSFYFFHLSVESCLHQTIIHGFSFGFSALSVLSVVQD